jgi:hypothetical protein
MTAEAAAAPRAITSDDIETLDTLALWSPPALGVPFIAGAMSWPGFTAQQMQEAWEAFQEAIEWREGLATGMRHWCERWDEDALPPGDGPQAAAIQLACEVADEARNHLLHGGPR